MNSSTLPLLVDPKQLQAALEQENLLVVDLCKPEIYAQFHVPGAVHLEYSSLVATEGQVMGLLPEPERLAEVFSALGLRPEHHVVAYDDEGGGKAGRLLWTLDAIGHQNASFLNGGLHAWAGEQFPVESDPVQPERSDYPITINEQAIAEREYIQANLNNSDVAILDCRTVEEFNGSKIRAAKAGHIPGAVNLDWVLAMDQQRNLRLRGEDELKQMYADQGITPDKEIIVYCHTHHRSSHTYVVLKALGFERVRGYPGSWSDWGNNADTPVE